MQITSVLFVASTLIASTITNAATVNFTGTLGFIEFDNGLSIYSGISTGDLFSGSFTYGDTSSQASSISSIPPISADYAFTGVQYGGVISDGIIITTGQDATVGIGNDDTMGDDATIINNLYGAGSTTAGAIADTWSIDSSNSNQFFGLAIYSLDTTLFSGLNFQVIPPTPGSSDFALFYIQEIDVLGNTIYLATGKINTLEFVPVPAAIWLFGFGLIGLFGIAGYKSRAIE